MPSLREIAGEFAVKEAAATCSCCSMPITYYFRLDNWEVLCRHCQYWFLNIFLNKEK
jgi:Zn finger protein HypA/HybF involved in hydrogenase expression